LYWPAALEAAGQYNDALNSYDRALEINPNFGQAKNNRMHVLLRLKSFNEAMDTFINL
jgi:tetratricopeptide (TPR) repeat protein